MIYISMIFGTRLRREWFSHEAIAWEHLVEENGQAVGTPE